MEEEGAFMPKPNRRGCASNCVQDRPGRMADPHAGMRKRAPGVDYPSLAATSPGYRPTAS